MEFFKNIQSNRQQSLLGLDCGSAVTTADGHKVKVYQGASS